jgi:hypothetical protein
MLTVPAGDPPGSVPWSPWVVEEILNVQVERSGCRMLILSAAVRSHSPPLLVIGGIGPAGVLRQRTAFLQLLRIRHLLRLQCHRLKRKKAPLVARRCEVDTFRSNNISVTEEKPRVLAAAAADSSNKNVTGDKNVILRVTAAAPGEESQVNSDLPSSNSSVEPTNLTTSAADPNPDRYPRSAARFRSFFPENHYLRDGADPPSHPRNLPSRHR